MSNKKLHDIWLRQKHQNEEAAREEFEYYDRMMNFDPNSDIYAVHKRLCDAELKAAQLEYENNILKMQLFYVKKQRNDLLVSVQDTEKLLMNPGWEPVHFNAEGRKGVRGMNIFGGIMRLQNMVAALTGSDKPNKRTIEEIFNDCLEFNHKLNSQS